MVESTERPTVDCLRVVVKGTSRADQRPAAKAHANLKESFNEDQCT